MTQKIKVALLLFAALCIISILLYLKNTSSTLPKELRDFAVEDTAGISKIFLADKNNKTITLVRKDGFWTVNELFSARKDLVDVMLKTICRLNVKAPVSKSTHNTIVKSLATSSVKVEIYQKDKLIKTFFVGGATPDNLGTYMLLEGSSTPFIMDIPGFFGYLTSRFTTDLNDWRDHSVFRYNFSDIANVEVNIPSAPTQSFRVSNLSNNRFSLESLAEGKQILHFDTNALKEFLASFKRLNFESFISDVSQKRKDSILKSTSLVSIAVTDGSGTRNFAKFYYKPNFTKKLSQDGDPFPYDPDRMYAFINQDKDLVNAQYFVFDPVMKELKYFLPQK